MEHDEGAVPRPRRSLRVVPSSPVPASPLPSAAGPAAPAPRRAPGVPARSPDIAALLADIDGLRRDLTTDLSLAAAAVDDGAGQLAVELVDGDRATLAVFEARALRRLGELEASDAAELAAAREVLLSAGLPGAELAPAAGAGEPPRQRGRGRLLPGASLVATAAALLGFLAGVVPDRSMSAPAAVPASSSATLASFSELTRLAREGAPPSRVAAAAEQLQRQLEVLLAQAGDDPAQAAEALDLLHSGSVALASAPDQDAVRQVLVEVLAMADRLRRSLPVEQTAVRDLVGRLEPRLPSSRPTSPSPRPRLLDLPLPEREAPRSPASPPPPAPAGERTPEPPASPAADPRPASSPSAEAGGTEAGAADGGGSDAGRSEATDSSSGGRLSDARISFPGL